MATLNTNAETSTPTDVNQPSGWREDHYTGVVVIHGIGNQKRDETLVESLNALTYWFNHHAGLDLQPEGSGRVWLTTDRLFSKPIG
jgi:hypothetical protein